MWPSTWISKQILFLRYVVAQSFITWCFQPRDMDEDVSSAAPCLIASFDNWTLISLIGLPIRLFKISEGDVVMASILADLYEVVASAVVIRGVNMFPGAR